MTKIYNKFKVIIILLIIIIGKLGEDTYGFRDFSNLYTFREDLVGIIIVFLVIGYIVNIFKLINLLAEWWNKGATPEFIILLLRVSGVFIPVIGGLVGWSSNRAINDQ